MLSLWIGKYGISAFLLVTAAVLSAPRNDNEGTVPEPPIVTVADRGPYTDNTIPWCIMGMDCVLPAEISEMYKGYYNLIVRNPEVIMNYPYYTCKYEYKGRKIRWWKPPSRSFGHKTTMIYYGPTTTITNMKSRPEFTEANYAKGIGVPMKKKLSENPHKVNFEDYGDEFVYTIYSSTWMKIFFSSDMFKLFIMKAPSKISFELDFNLDLRVTFDDLVAGPVIKLVASLEGDAEKRVGHIIIDDAAKKPSSDIEVETESCGKDRIALIQLGELFEKENKDVLPVYIWLVPYTPETVPPLLQTLYLMKPRDNNDLKITVEKDNMILTIENLKIWQNAVDFAVVSAITSDGTPTFCGSGSAHWYISGLKSESKDKITLRVPIYLSGQRVLLCAAGGSPSNDISAYTSYIGRFMLDSQLPIGFGNVINVDATGKAQISIMRDVHPMSEIILVESTDVVKYGVVKENKSNIIKEKTALRDLDEDRKLIKSLGNVALDGSAIRRRVECPEELPLESIHTLAFPPNFAYRLGNGAYWATKQLFLPQMLYVTDKAYVVLLCDRWKHPHCLSESDFTEVGGVILPNRFIHSGISTTWEAGNMVLIIPTLPFNPIAPFVKLIRVAEDTHYDYDKLCNVGPFIYARLRDSKYVEDIEMFKKLSSSTFTTYYSHRYDVIGIEEGYRYCVCYTFQERKVKQKTKNVGGVNVTPLNTETSNKYPVVGNWSFMTMINPQTISAYQKTIVRTEAKDKNEIIFSTTGLINNLKIRGVYLSEDLLYDCSHVEHHLPQRYDASALEINVEPKRKGSTFLVPLALKQRPTNNKKNLPKGLWLSTMSSHWVYSHKSSYLLYQGPLHAKEDRYLACFCYDGGCTRGGEVAISGTCSVSVTRFLEGSGFTNVIMNETLLCLYGHNDLQCFNKKNGLYDTIVSPVSMMKVIGEINYAFFHNRHKCLVAIREDVMWRYSGGTLSSPKWVRVMPDIVYMHVSAIITFVCLANGHVYLDLTDAALNQASDHFYAAASSYLAHNEIKHDADKYDAALLKDLENVLYADEKQSRMNEEVYLKPQVDNYIELTGLKGRLLKMAVLDREKTGGYYIFYIDESLQLHCTYAVLSSSESNLLEFGETTTVALDVGMDRPLECNIAMRVEFIHIADMESAVVFVHIYGYHKMSVFYTKEWKLYPYNEIYTNPMIVDFAIHNARMYALTKEVSIYGALSQSIIEVDLEESLKSTMYYKDFPSVMYRNEMYNFTPSFVGTSLVYFSPVDKDAWNSIGLSLDSQTGYIYGYPKAIGDFSLRIEARGFFSKYLLTISSHVRCDKGSYVNSITKECTKCKKGEYWSVKESGETCISCDTVIKGSTTREDGSKSSYDCVCAPGTYYSNNTCIACPRGTTSESYSSTNCPVIMLSDLMVQNTTIEVVSCKSGTYKKGDTCLHCPVGSYCLGGDLQPIRCSVGMTTKEPGAHTSDSCVCNLGYEWVNGACAPCNRKSFKDSIGNTLCTPCEEGKESNTVVYTPAYGATSRRQCIYCNKGFFFDANRTACVECPMDSFCPGGGSIPLFCPNNTVTQKTKAISVNDCACIKGYGYGSTTRYVLSLDNTCSVCPKNTFQHINGSNMDCMPCPHNTYTTSAGATSLAECLPKPGYYIAAGDSFLTDVNRMESLKPKELDEATVTCIADVYVEDEIAVTVLARSLRACVDICKGNIYCRYAYYLYSQNVVSHTEPRLSEQYIHSQYAPCKLIMSYEKVHIPRFDFSSGKSVYDSANSSNVLCMLSRPAMNLNYNNLSVLKCAMNYYCPGGDRFKMFRCPENSVTLTPGSTNMANCLCLPGFEFSNQASQSTCVPCQEGFFKDSTSNGRCTACPLRMTTQGKGSVSASQCMCSVGYFATPTGKAASSPEPPMHADLDYSSILNASVMTNLLARNFNYTNKKESSRYPNIIECKPCPEGYVCPAKWLPYATFSIHSPPISCPEGSSVPSLSHKADSMEKCICKPGYGSGKSYGDKMFFSCQKCAPGTYSETHGTSSCPGRCNDYAITFPGASSFKDCFCLPGRFMTLHMIDNEYKFVCNKCAEGTICPGGFRDPHSPISRSENPQIAILNHTPQYPRMGYMAIFKRKSVRGKQGMEWKPNDANTYIVHPPVPSQFGHYEHISDIHPCIYPNRCMGSGSNICLEGSTGYLCGKCKAGYETRYFQSICTKCGKRRVEILRLIVPRLVLLLLVLIACYLNHEASCEGDFSFIVIFKIWYMFVFSLIPLGMQQLTTTSSLRHFYNLHHNYFYKSINFFMNVERVGCWEPYIRTIINFLNSKGLPRNILDGSQELDYIQIWYIKRAVAIVKPFIDVIILCLIYVPCHIIYKTYFSLGTNSSRIHEIESRIRELKNMVLSKSSEKNKEMEQGLGTSLLSCDDKNEKDSGSLVSHYVERRKLGRVFLLQQILMVLTLHFPSVVLNSLSMLWCTSVRYKQEPIINVIMHLPDQVCDMNNALFRYGRMIGAANLLLWVVALFLLFWALCLSTYSPRSWNAMFMSGCDINCRWWDVVHLSRQFFLACIIVCQYNMDPKGDTEYMRTTCYMILHIAYMALHLTFSPYDDRDNARFYNLECLVYFSNIFMCIFIQGSYFYDFSDLDGLLTVISLMVHIKIIWTILIEYGNIKFAKTKREGKGDFICTVFDFLPFAWEHHRANIYYDYKNDDIVLDSSEWRRNRRSLYNALIVTPFVGLKRVLGFGGRSASNSRSCTYNLHNREFLMSCIKASIEKSNLFKDKMLLSNSWIYFIVRYVFWYCHCLHTDIRDKNISANSLFHKVVFMHFFQKNNILDAALARFLANFPLNKLYSHASAHHNGEPCDGKCEVFTTQKKYRRMDAVAESLLVDCLFDIIYDLGPVSLVEFYFGLLSLNQLESSVVLRLFEGFRIHSLFLKNEKEFHLKCEEGSLKQSISQLKHKIEQKGEVGSVILKHQTLATQIEVVEESIRTLQGKIKSEKQIIMAGRSAAAAALNLHLGVDNIVNEGLSHDDILNAISSLTAFEANGSVPGSGTENSVAKPDNGNVPVYKMRH